MPPSDKLSHIEYLHVMDPDSRKLFCGSNQEWFPDEWQRRAGCGPSVAANILFYLNRKENFACCGGERGDLLCLMEDAWKSVTPEINGIPSTTLFLKKLKQYAHSLGKNFVYFALDIPPRQAERPSLSAVIKFVSQGLRGDVPIAFLNLDQGAEKNLESWHWVTITALSYSGSGRAALVTICDEGTSKQIDLKLWLETTTQGGGFVYFKESAAPRQIQRGCAIGGR